MRARFRAWRGWLVGFGLLAGLAVLCLRAGTVVRVAVGALALAYLAEPAVERLSNGAGRVGAALIVFVGGGLLAAGLFAVLILPACRQLLYLPSGISAVLEEARGTIARLSVHVPEAILPGAETLGRVARQLTSALASGAARFLSALSEIAVSAVLAFFYLLDWNRLSIRLALFVPSGWRARAIRAARSVRRELGTYLRGQLVVMAAVSVLAVAVLYATRTPLAAALGVLYGMLNAIPYFGPLIGTIPPVVAALAGGWRRALLTLGMLLLVQQIDNYGISPRVMSSAAGASPATVLLAVSAGSALGGVWGMFLALPIYVAARALWRAFSDTPVTVTEG